MDTVYKSSDTLDYLRGNGDYTGETKWILDDHLSNIGIELKQIEDEIHKIEEKEVHTESVIAKILDADIAANATQLAKSKVRSDIAASCISKSIRINDALIQLTTNHHRGELIKG